jgi:hypothetical protein
MHRNKQTAKLLNDLVGDGVRSWRRLDTERFRRSELFAGFLDFPV